MRHASGTTAISIHAPRTGSDLTASTAGTRTAKRFQSTLPARGATGTPDRLACSNAFQSTLPARGATASVPPGREGRTDFNPRSPHGERRGKRLRGRRARGISIHAPRTGSDRDAVAHGWSHGHFNPRSPHGERPKVVRSGGDDVDFNPRSPHGERPGNGGRTHDQSHFNPRSPHGERLQRSPSGQLTAQLFQSTLPARGATPSAAAVWRTVVPFQSTLPARGATSSRRCRCSRGWDFNPRSPHGERPACTMMLSCLQIFQSTLPARGATVSAESCAL